MTTARRATPADAAEVLRLRQIMIDSMSDADTSTDWHLESLPTLRARLAAMDGGPVPLHLPGLPPQTRPPAGADTLTS
jgi:hypothetical protein